MKIGTKSVLFGAHQFLLHPIFVAVAWWHLYGFPWAPRLWVAFIVHDLGYLGKPNMDGKEGESHPHLGAQIMGWLFDPNPRAWLCPHPRCDDGSIFSEDLEFFDDDAECPICRAEHDRVNRWHDFTLFHSRFMAKKCHRPHSRLCVADKLATVLVPAWLYLLLTNLTGEIREYMDVSQHREGGKYSHEIRILDSQREWFESMCTYMRAWIAEHKDGRQDTWTPGPKESGAA